MHEKIICVLLIVVAVIHIIPLSGVVGGAKIELLYGIQVASKELEILLRHRAVLFGMLGFFILYAAFTPTLQPLAFIAAFISITSFFVLAFSVGDFNAEINRIVTADIVATISLVGAVVIYYFVK